MFPVPAETLSEETKNDDPCSSVHPFPPGWKTPAYHVLAAGKQGASINGMPMKCNERHTMETKETLQSLDEWSRQELKDILDFYINYDYDPKGGFYGAVLRTLEPVREADRSIVLNARLMWTFASAYRLLKDPRYLEMAEGYITKLALDEDGEIIGYEFVRMGPMMEMIKKGMDANEAVAKCTGNYGRFDEAAKYIDPRHE